MAEIFKILGQSAPAATTNTSLYTVPAATNAVVSTIVVANRSATAATYRIAIRPNGAALANSHYIAFDVTVGGSDSTNLTLGLTLNAGDIVTVYSGNANLTFSAFGSEVTA
jgi:glucose-6-phosphate dehydrogenase assembly protein OpcA